MSGGGKEVKKMKSYKCIECGRRHTGCRLVCRNCRTAKRREALIDKKLARSARIKARR